MTEISKRILSYWKQLPLEALAGKTIKRVYKSDDRLVLLFHDPHDWVYYKVEAQVGYCDDADLEPAEVTWDDLTHLGVLSEEDKAAHKKEEQEYYANAKREEDIRRIRMNLFRLSPALREQVLKEIGR